MIQQNSLVPVEIGRVNQHDVKIRWQDGHESMYPARGLRLACPCAGCAPPPVAAPEAHIPPLAGAPGGGVASSVPHNVYPLKIDLIGRYAMSIQWSDGHNTGIYAFDRLRAMCPCESCRLTRRQPAEGS